MPEVEFRREGHLAHIRLNRPEVYNALNLACDEALAEMWREVNDDPEVWAVLLSAAGDKAFCAGADLNDVEERSTRRMAIGGGLTGLGGPRVVLHKPLVAAVQGHVLGSGLELALCADIIIAADSAVFGIPETRLGLLGEAGVIHRITRQVPHRVAMGMILAGEPLPAADALHFGMINEVVPAGDLLDRAHRWAERIIEASPLTVQAAKQAVESRLGWPLETALTTRYEPIEALMFTEDRREALDAFKARRPPVWAGR